LQGDQGPVRQALPVFPRPAVLHRRRRHIFAEDPAADLAGRRVLVTFDDDEQEDMYGQKIGQSGERVGARFGLATDPAFIADGPVDIELMMGCVPFRASLTLWESTNCDTDINGRLLPWMQY
jgi:hypothetical protein